MRTGAFFSAWLALASAAAAADASTPPLGPVAARLERVVDGDTVKMRATIWIDQELRVSVRLAGIDAPELFGPECAEEKRKARAAKAFVEDFLKAGEAKLHDIKRGKYAGRVIARIEADGRDLAAALLAAGHAVAGAKGEWCAGAPVRPGGSAR